MAHLRLQAAEQLAAEGIDAEVIDVRSLVADRLRDDRASVHKTGRVVIVEEGPKTGGVSAEIAAGIMERVPRLAPWRASLRPTCRSRSRRCSRTPTGPTSRGSLRRRAPFAEAEDPEARSHA